MIGMLGYSKWGMWMLDFFIPPDDQCVKVSAPVSYLYDGEGDAPAIISEVVLRNNPVVVENPGMLMVVFRPIDKGVYGPGDPKRGDVFLHTVDRLRLYFVELKLWRVSGWFKVGVEQLKSVITAFNSMHSDVSRRALVRRAYICNPHRPSFAYSHANEIRDFRRETNFVLYPEGRVKVGE